MLSIVRNWAYRLIALMRPTTRDRCRDLRWCIRIDDKTCCLDRIRAEASLVRLRDERALWGG